MWLSYMKGQTGVMYKFPCHEYTETETAAMWQQAVERRLKAMREEAAQ